MNIEERAEALKIARGAHATDEANNLADLSRGARGAHAGRAVLLYEVDALTAERDAWKAYAAALRSPVDGKLGDALRRLRELGLTPA